MVRKKLGLDKKLVENIIFLHEKDNEDPQKQSKILYDFYRKQNWETQRAMDKVTIAICGYSIDTLTHKPKEWEYLIK